MQAITTKHWGATETKPARIVARTASGIRHTLSIHADEDHAADHGDAHARAAVALCEHLGWFGRLHRGGLDGFGGQVFVFENADPIVVRDRG